MVNVNQVNKDIRIGKNLGVRITVSFPHDQLLVSKVKDIESHRWHPDKKYGSFPKTDETLEKILKVFGDERKESVNSIFTGGGYLWT